MKKIRTVSFFIKSYRTPLFGTIISSALLLSSIYISIPSLLQTLIALFYSLFVPGYSVIEAIYVKRVFDRLEHFILSCSLSIVLLSLTGAILNILPFGVRSVPLSLSLVSLSLIFISIGAYRRFRRKETSELVEETSRLHFAIFLAVLAILVLPYLYMTLKYNFPIALDTYEYIYKSGYVYSEGHFPTLLPWSKLPDRFRFFPFFSLYAGGLSLISDLSILNTYTYLPLLCAGLQFMTFFVLSKRVTNSFLAGLAASFIITNYLLFRPNPKNFALSFGFLHLFFLFRLAQRERGVADRILCLFFLLSAVLTHPGIGIQFFLVTTSFFIFSYLRRKENADARRLYSFLPKVVLPLGSLGIVSYVTIMVVNWRMSGWSGGVFDFIHSLLRYHSSIHHLLTPVEIAERFLYTSFHLTLLSLQEQLWIIFAVLAIFALITLLRKRRSLSEEMILLWLISSIFISFLSGLAGFPRGVEYFWRYSLSVALFPFFILVGVGIQALSATRFKIGLYVQLGDRILSVKSKRTFLYGSLLCMLLLSVSCYHRAVDPEKAYRLIWVKPDEYRFYEWIRLNTPKDSIFMVPPERAYFFVTLTQRDVAYRFTDHGATMYNQTDATAVESIYGWNETKREKFLLEYGVDYLCFYGLSNEYGIPHARNLSDSQMGIYSTEIYKADEYALFFINRTRLRVMRNYWLNRRPVIIDNRENPNNLTEYQIFLNVTYYPLMDPDFKDLRFTWYNSTSGGEQEISYWVRKTTRKSYAEIWIKVPEILANTYYSSDNTTIYLYYGRLGVNSASDFEAVFFSDFDEPGMVAEWHIDEVSGSIIEDSTNQDNDGILRPNATAGPRRVEGRFGKGLNFDGEDDWVEVPSDPSLELSGEFAIEGWFKTASDGTGTFVTLNDGTDAQRIALVCGGPYERRVRAWISGMGWIEGKGTTLNANSWYHVVWNFYDGGTKLDIYLDGSVYATWTGLDLPYVDRIWIGKGEVDRDFKDGTVDEIRIYNHALSAEEISYHYLPRNSSGSEPIVTIGPEERGIFKLIEVSFPNP